MNLTLHYHRHCLLFVISLLLTQFVFSQTSYEWQKKTNVAQYKGADWNNLLFKKSNINLEQAFEIADTNENVNYFFFMKSSMFLEGKSGPKGFTEKGLFKKGDAVFFSGKPWLSSAPMADSYVKIPKPDSYNPKIEKTKDGATLLKYAPIKFARGTTKIIDGTESVIIKLAQ